MSNPKFLSLTDSVRENLHDGAFAAFEGFSHLIPYAAAHEAIRQGIKDLTLVRMTPDVIYDQFVGMGRVKKLIFAYVGNPGVGLLRRVRDSIENGWPHRIEFEEHSHAAMASAYEAGAALRGVSGLSWLGPARRDQYDSMGRLSVYSGTSSLCAIHPPGCDLHSRQPRRRAR